LPAEDFAQRLDEVLRKWDAQRQQRLDALRAQIEILDRVLQRRTGSGVSKDAAPSGEPPHGTHPPAESPAHPSSPPGAPHPPATPKQPSLPAEQALGGDPVDPQALADSLFGAGEIQMALEAYGGLSLDTLTDADRRWIRYQLAACHRQLGQTGKAEQVYREVLAENNQDPLAAQARWWLDTIERRKRLQSSLQGIEATLRGLQEGKP
jgi:TolA-binding protein